MSGAILFIVVKLYMKGNTMNTLFEKFVKDTNLTDLSLEDLYDQSWLPVPNDNIEKNAYTHWLADNLRLFITSVTNKLDQSQNVTVTVYNNVIDCITHVYIISNTDQCDAAVREVKNMLLDPTHAQIGRTTESPSAVN